MNNEVDLQAQVNAAAAIVKLRGAEHRILSAAARNNLAEAKRIVAYGHQRGIDPEEAEVAILVAELSRRGAQKARRDSGGQPVR